MNCGKDGAQASRNSMEENFAEGYDLIFGPKVQPGSRVHTAHPDVLDLIRQRGRVDPSSLLHQEAEAMARRLGFEGEVIVLEGSNEAVGAQMYHSMPSSHGGRAFAPPERVLLLYEGNYVKGWARMGNTLYGEAQVAHELGHLSPTLPPEYRVGTAYDALNPRRFLKEAAASLLEEFQQVKDTNPRRVVQILIELRRREAMK
jgi:hypothetical protein